MYTPRVMITLAIVAFAAVTLQPVAEPNARVVVQWDTFGFAPSGLGDPAVKKVELQNSAPPSMLVQSMLGSGGLLGGAVQSPSASHGWAAAGTALAHVQLPPENGSRLQLSKDVPEGWFTLDAAKKESAGAIMTVDLNAMRSASQELFDAPWFQRTLSRLALDNGRLVSLRATLNPPAADGLPPLLSVKAFASARSVAPGPARAITLVAPGWSGNSTDAAAVTGAHWAASLRFDAGGLGVIGRDGGSGTLAGFVRLAVDLVGTANNADTAVWSKAYTAWQERTADPLRSLTTRLQQRGTLACYGSLAAPDLVLVVQARKGERADTLTKALDQLAAAGGIAARDGVWTLKDGGPLTPRLTVMVCDTGLGPYVVATIEHHEDLALLKQTAARLRQAK